MKFPVRFEIFTGGGQQQNGFGGGYGQQGGGRGGYGSGGYGAGSDQNNGYDNGYDQSSYAPSGGYQPPATYDQQGGDSYGQQGGYGSGYQKPAAPAAASGYDSQGNTSRIDLSKNRVR